MVELISAMLMPGLILQAKEPDPDLVAWRVRVYADKQVDGGTVRPALEVAGDLLASAGIVVSWRVCDVATRVPDRGQPGARDCRHSFVPGTPETARAAASPLTAHATPQGR